MACHCTSLYLKRLLVVFITAAASVFAVLEEVGIVIHLLDGCFEIDEMNDDEAVL